MRRQTWARVVLTLLLAAALVPTLSRGLARARGVAEPWLQGCISVGQARADARVTPADAGAWQHLLEHCPLCALDRDGPDAPPPAPATTALWAGPAEGPSTTVAQPHGALQARWRVQPRAPPSLS